MPDKLTIAKRKKIAKEVFRGLRDAGEQNVSYTGSTFVEIKKGPATLIGNINEDGNLVVAGLLPASTQKSGFDYLNDASAYDSTNNDREKIIQLSRKAVAVEGVVASAIEALVEVPTLGGWYVDEENEELRKLCEYWLENIDAIGYDESSDYETVQSIGGVESLVLNVLYGLYENGDEVVGEIWDYVTVPELGKKFNLPMNFISYDVVNLKIDETLASIGKEIIYLKVNEKIKDIIVSGPKDDNEKEILDSLPDDLISQVRKNDSDYYKLDQRFITHFSRKNNKRSPWGMPYIYRAFSALAYKYRLRALDNATIDGLIQRIWIIKIGNDDPQSPLHIPDETRVALALSALKNLKTNNILLWGGSDISTEELGSSDASVLSFESRYKNADDDIQKALGVPRFLIDGDGLSGGTSDWILLAKTISQMERYQIMIERWINRKLRQIAIENNFKKSFPKFHWTFLRLQNPEKTKNLVTELYKNNLIGIRRTLHMLGLPAEEIVNEMIAENKEGLRDKLPINILPYNGTPGRPPGVGDGDGTDGRKNKTSNPDSNRDGK